MPSTALSSATQHTPESRTPEFGRRWGMEMSKWEWSVLTLDFQILTDLTTRLKTLNLACR